MSVFQLLESANAPCTRTIVGLGPLLGWAAGGLEPAAAEATPVPTPARATHVTMTSARRRHAMRWNISDIPSINIYVMGVYSLPRDGPHIKRAPLARSYLYSGNLPV